MKVSKVKITGLSKALLTGKKMTLKAVIIPSNGSDQKVSRSVNNKKYAFINSRGVVTAKTASAGKTVAITVKAKDESGKQTSIRRLSHLQYPFSDLYKYL